MDSRYFPLNTILTPHLGHVQQEPTQSDEVGGPVVEDGDSIGEADLDTDCIHRPL